MKWHTLTPLLVAFTLNAWTPVHANVVTEWNAITVACAYGPPPPVLRGGPPATLDIALVQGAVHDAVQAIYPQFESYAYVNPAMLGVGSVEAAAAAAAYHVLVGLYGAGDACLAAVPDPAVTYAGDAGLQAGMEAAATMLFEVRPKHTLPTDPFVGNDALGQWRPTPGVVAGDNTFMAHSLPFAMDRPRQFRLIPPPELTSERYTLDYNEVKAIGSQQSSVRTPAQTDMAVFWGALPGPTWQSTLRGIADEHLTDISATARLFALANFAGADALISAFETAYYYNHWRPITAIHEGDNDGNPDTLGDAQWISLFAVAPAEPEYPSGSSALAGAMTETLKLFFGTDEFGFSIKGLLPQPRQYTRFSQAAEEVVEARVLQGYHFRTSANRGRLQGRSIAQCAFNNYLRQLTGPL